jgi:hypothetical protein
LTLRAVWTSKDRPAENRDAQSADGAVHPTACPVHARPVSTAENAAEALYTFFFGFFFSFFIAVPLDMSDLLESRILAGPAAAR